MNPERGAILTEREPPLQRCGEARGDRSESFEVRPPCAGEAFALQLLGAQWDHRMRQRPAVHFSFSEHVILYR